MTSEIADTAVVKPLNSYRKTLCKGVLSMRCEVACRPDVTKTWLTAETHHVIMIITFRRGASGVLKENIL